MAYHGSLVLARQKATFAFSNALGTNTSLAFSVMVFTLR